jgi:hypothetical protein
VTWRARGDIRDVVQWRKVDQLGAALEELAKELDQRRDREWLGYLLREVAKLLPNVLEEGWDQDYLAEFILGIYDALTYLTMLQYYLVFMDHQGYISEERAREVGRLAREVQEDISLLLGRMRSELMLIQSDMDPRRLN